MALNLPPEHPLRIEMERWDKPYQFHRYPAMLYMARRSKDGRWLVSDPADDGFTASCQRIVHSEGEEQRAKDEGWREDPKSALEYRDKLEKMVADAAAHRAYEDRLMSPKAKAEAAAAEEESFDHVAEVPEKRRVGRPRKDASAA